MNEYQEMWNSLRDYLEYEENSPQEISVSRVVMMMNLMEKFRIGE